MESRRPKEIYTPIHALPRCELKDPCVNLKILEFEKDGVKYCVAYCTVLERYLTKSAVKRCETLWRTCPFAKRSLTQP
ncbi:MAG: hypothetical protein OWQ48_03990 [Desulfurococcus sp.]|nr:hypothetical protein [Desulfurococcus sp.]